jgi:hypothetical protein
MTKYSQIGASTKGVYKSGKNNHFELFEGLSGSRSLLKGMPQSDKGFLLFGLGGDAQKVGLSDR